MNRFSALDTFCRFVLRQIAATAAPSLYDGPVSEESAISLANSAHRLNSPPLAALALRQIDLLDCRTSCGIQRKRSRLLSLSASLPEPETKQSTRVSYDEISWAIQGNQPDPFDLLSRPRSCPHVEIHPDDKTPIVRSVADDYSPAFVHSVYNP